MLIIQSHSNLFMVEKVNKKSVHREKNVRPWILAVLSQESVPPGVKQRHIIIIQIQYSMNWLSKFYV